MIKFAARRTPDVVRERKTKSALFERFLIILVEVYEV